MEMIKECKGCIMFEHNICNIFRSKQKHVIEKCPCGKCLVKMICKNTCEDYNEFHKELPYD